jgi:hypothetical protein
VFFFFVVLLLLLALRGSREMLVFRVMLTVLYSQWWLLSLPFLTWAETAHLVYAQHRLGWGVDQRRGRWP